MRILVADDSRIVRERIIKLLSSLKGIETIEESDNVKDTLAEIRQNTPNVVILDLEFNEGSGIDVLRELKNDSYIPVVVVLTNYDYPAYRNECSQYGAKFFFDKSRDFKKVKDTVKVLIDTNK